MTSRASGTIGLLRLLLWLLSVATAFAAEKTSAKSDVVDLEIAGSVVRVVIKAEDLELSRPELLDWIRGCARAVSRYYDKFPVPHVRLVVSSGDGRGVGGGRTFGNPATIFIRIGRASTRADLDRDWVLTHEMVHLAFPSVPAEHHWIEEGVATYVEPLARRRVGQLSEEKVWGDLVVGLPRGLPQAGDRGLDFTPTWGRTYWGGALFCLLADIDIRERTHNRYGLRDALRAINAAGGSIEVDWSLPRALEIGDKAIGVPALTEQYQRMRAAPAPVDLDRLWQRLGVEVRERRLLFSDAAPLAPIRRAISERETVPVSRVRNP